VNKFKYPILKHIFEGRDFGELMILLFGKINLSGENKEYLNFNSYCIE
jgi:hypothetical protein